MSDLIRREDAIKALRYEYPTMPIFKGLREEWAIKTEGFRKAEEVIMSVPSADRPQGEWIPCSERLPNEKEIVLITNDKGNVRFGQFRGTHGKYWIWKGNTLETVLAWMPLPKPWKGEDDDIH